MPKVFRFGDFAFDAASGVLMRGDRPSLLGGRAAALLAILLENDGRPVLKEALMERAWEGLAVEDSNLTVQISAIRSALRDDGEADWIETLPRRGYRYAGPRVSTPGGTELRPKSEPASGRPSIAVLPFENRSPDATPAYLAEGMVEDIIIGLARIKWLFVIGKETSFRYREQPVDMRVIARELDVRYVLSGSLQQIPQRIRLSAHLAEAETGRTVWAERFDRASEDLFALQDEIALAVLAALEPGLREAELARLRRHRPRSLDAYDLVLRSQPDVFSGMPNRSRQALALIEEALRLEPEYALAHGYASMAHHNVYLRGGLGNVNRKTAVEHARAAIQYGQDDSTAMALGAFSLAMDNGDLRGSLPAFEAAMDVSPSTALTYMLASAVHGWAGDPNIAKDLGNRALRLSPLDPWRFAAWHGLMLGAFRERDYDQSLDAACRSVTANPGHSISYALLAAALLRCGRTREARTAASRVVDLQPMFGSRAHLMAVNCEAALAAELLTAFDSLGLSP